MPVVVIVAVVAPQWRDLIPTNLASVASPRPAGWPSPAQGVSSTPLSAPPPIANPSSAHAFVAMQPDGTSPVTYDPCREVHVVVRPDGQPAGATALLEDSLTSISTATGLTIVNVGATTEAPAPDRPLVDLERYGDRWAPVLIAWVTAEESPDLAADVLGQAGSVAVSTPEGTSVFVTGQVELDAAQFTDLLARPDGANLARAAITHELGHLVGRGHVADSTQLMYPQIQPTVTDVADGDLTGLAELGRGACVPGL